MTQRRLISDGVWVALAQFSAAVGALITVRILTELLTPFKFGLLALCLGAVTLVLGLFCTPILQALLRYYPDYEARGSAAELCATAKRILVRRGVLVAVFGTIGGGIASIFVPVSFEIVLMLAFYLLIEIWRSYELNIFNPTRRQKRFAAVTLADACLRPSLAWIAAQVMGFEVEAVLLGFMFASAGCAGASKILNRNSHAAQDHSMNSIEIERRISEFSVPLIPLALISWCNATVDRYIIATILGSAQAGIYAAASGLMSRPFLMVGHIVEQTLRPIYYEATSRGHSGLAKKIFILWIGLVSMASIVGVALVLWLAEDIARIFLGAYFREGTDAMRWIAAGYGVLTITQALERQFYALYQTRRILLIEGVGLAAMLAVLPFLLVSIGIVGAAVALTIGAMVQATMVSFAIYSSRSRNKC